VSPCDLGAAIPLSDRDLDADWIAGALGFGRPSQVTVEPIGVGQMSRTVRLRIDWPPGSRPGPGSLVAKLAVEDEKSRSVAVARRLYETEVGFFTELAEQIPVSAPRCHWAAYDQEQRKYALVFEDVTVGSVGDQLSGCTAEDAAAALSELAVLHAPFWGDHSLGAIGWLNRYRAEEVAYYADSVRAAASSFVARFSEELGPECSALVQRVAARFEDYDRWGFGGPRTVVHGDFRNDNLIFGGSRVCVLDWQVTHRGCGLADLSYFLGGSLLPEDRRRTEEDLVREYHERLVAAGVDLAWDWCWREYRRHALAGIIMAVRSAAMLAETEYSDALFLTMGSRHCLHALDLGTETLLGAD